MIDLLELLLSQLRFKTRVFHRGFHCGNWQLDLEQSDRVLFHFVCEGRCEIELFEQQKSFDLSKGDLLLFARPGKHIIRNSNNSLEISSSSSDKSGLICAYVEFDSSDRNYLLEALPNHIVTQSDSHKNNNWLTHLLDLLFSESEAEMTASNTVIERLMDILFVHVIRSYLTYNRELTGVLAAFRDPKLRPVLELMHQEPNKPWALGDFANIANLSRSAFIDNFSRLLGTPPMAYLNQQRLRYAYYELCEGRRKVLDLAMECGYETESSFSKAFKRQYRISPGVLRRINCSKSDSPK